MAQTVIRGTQILNNTVQRQDLDISTVGQAVVTKLIQGSGINLSSTGADSGTGDVTVSSPDVVSTDAGNIATLGTDNHILVPQSQITSIRLRSYQALSNSTFEVDQRNIGAALTNPASGTFIQDRWPIFKSAGLTGTVNTALQNVPSAPVVIPGTNFGITQNYQRFTVGTAQASLAAGDYWYLQQFIEGPRWRELSMDVHSLSLLVRSSVANLAFSASLRDSGATHSLVKQCTLGATPNTWTLIPLANLPVWSGTFSAAPGQVGYTLAVVLAAGTTFTAAASSAWQAANMLGITGMSNFLATAGATFDISFISHEPGALCTTPMDCPFGQNLDGDMGCSRYFQKSYQYAIKPGTASQSSYSRFSAISAVSGTTYTLYGDARFSKRMAKVPTCTVYNPNSGAANALDGWYATSGTIPNANAALTATGVVASESNILAVQMASGTSTAQIIGFCEWTADTGW